MNDSNPESAAKRVARASFWEPVEETEEEFAARCREAGVDFGEASAVLQKLRAAVESRRAVRPGLATEYVIDPSGPRFRGGGGTVEFGTSLATGLPVAVKRIVLPAKAEAPPDLTGVAELKRTAEPLKWNLVEYLAHGYWCAEDRKQTQKVYSVVMPKAARTLEELLVRRGPLAESEVVSLLLVLVRVLAELEKQRVVHRDLKPENVLLYAAEAGVPAECLWTVGGQRYRPVVADLGLAKTVPPDSGVLTPTAPNLGTQEYMSPEQLLGRPLDSRTDQYALGILLARCLTGRVPFPAPSQDRTPIQRTTSESGDRHTRVKRVPPPRLAELAAEQDELAKEPKHRVKQSIDDRLERIFRKCLRKHPNRRYRMAADLEHDLSLVANQVAKPTLLAEPLSRQLDLEDEADGDELLCAERRRSGRWMWWAVAALAVTAVVLGVGTVVSTANWLRAEAAVRDRDVALEEKGRALATVRQAKLELDREFRAKVAALEESERQRIAKETALGVATARLDQLTALFGVFGQVLGGLDPRTSGAQGKPLTALLGQRIDEANAELDRLAVPDPLLIAQFRVAVGSALLGVGSHDRALPQFTMAYEIRNARHGPDHPDALHARSGMASALEAAGDLKAAVPMAKDVFDRLRATLGPDHPATLLSQNNLAGGYSGLGEHQSAIGALIDVLERRSRHPQYGATHPDTLATRGQLGATYIASGQVQLAINLLEKVHQAQIDHPTLGREHYHTLVTAHSLGWAYFQAGRLDAAETLLKSTYDLQVWRLGSNHPKTLKTAAVLASAYAQQGKRGQAIPLLRDALAVQTRTLGPTHPHTLATQHNLGATLLNDGQWQEAIRHLEAAVGGRAKRFGADSPHTLRTASNLGFAYLHGGQGDRAIRLLEDTREGWERQTAVTADHPDVLNTLTYLGAAYRAARRFDRAIPLLERVHALRSARAETGADLAAEFVAGQQLAWAYRDGGRPDDAVGMLEEILCRMPPHLPGRERHPKALEVARDLAFTYFQADRRGDGRAALAGYVDTVAAAMQGRPLEWSNRLMDVATDCLSRRLTGEAEPLLRKALALRQAVIPDHWATFATQSLLGQCLVSRRRYADAEPLLTDAFVGLRRRAATIPLAERHVVADTADQLVRLFTATGDRTKVAAWRAERANYPREQPPPPRPAE